MNKINTVLDLKISIRELEFQQANEWAALKVQVLAAYESFSPRNVIQNTLVTLLTGMTKGYIAKDLIKRAVGVAAEILSKK